MAQMSTGIIQMELMNTDCLFYLPIHVQKNLEYIISVQHCIWIYLNQLNRRVAHTAALSQQ